MLRQEIPWIDGQPSADEVERASEDRGGPNGRHRRGSRSNRNKGGGAHGASQHRSEGQRKDNGGREGHKAHQAHPQQNQQRPDHQPPKTAQPAHNPAPRPAHSQAPRPAQSPAPKPVHTHTRLTPSFRAEAAAGQAKRPPRTAPQAPAAALSRRRARHGRACASVHDTLGASARRRTPALSLISNGVQLRLAVAGGFEARLGRRRERYKFAAAAGACLVRVVEHEA